MGNQIKIALDENGGDVFVDMSAAGPVFITNGSRSERHSALALFAQCTAQEGIPVLLTDTKGNFSALSSHYDVTLWDLNGSSGLPLRTTVTELGPLLISKLLGLNENQEDLLRIIFKIADDSGLLLIDTKDLKALINEIIENNSVYAREYGMLNTTSLSAIIHALVSLETKGAGNYLFEPAIDVGDLCCAQPEGRINILDAENQYDEKQLYCVFLLFILGELYEHSAGAADAAPHPFVILADEADFFFEAIEGSLEKKVVKILEGLSENGILTVFSLADIKKAKITEELDNYLVMSMQQEGEALFYDARTAQEAARRINLLPGAAPLRALSARERTQLNENDPLHEKYKIPFERDSAYEFLKRRGLDEYLKDTQSPGLQDAENAAKTAPENEDGSESAGDTAPENGGELSESASQADEEKRKEKNADLQSAAKRAKSSAKSLGSTVAGTVGRKVGKSVGSSFGSFGETLGGNIGASLGRGIINTLFKS